MVTTSLESMTVLAAHASAALDLLEVGLRDDKSVLMGLRDGEAFCEFLAKGTTAQTSQHFSASGLVASDYVQLVFSMPGGNKLTEQLPAMRQKLSEILMRVQDGRMLNKRSVEELRVYFFTVAERLPVYEGIRDRLMEDTRKRV